MKLERLTSSGDFCFIHCVEKQEDLTKIRENCPIFDKCFTRNMWEKLKEYEDAEECGTLLKPVVKNEQEVFRINRGARNPVIPMIVVEICYTSIIVSDEPVFRFKALDKSDGGEYWYFSEEVGKTVFLTKEEAEKVLKELS